MGEKIGFSSARLPFLAIVPQSYSYSNSSSYSIYHCSQVENLVEVTPTSFETPLPRSRDITASDVNIGCSSLIKGEDAKRNGAHLQKAVPKCGALQEQWM